MKRLRVKLIGFGCAVLTSTAIGADGPWQTAGSGSAPPPPAPVQSQPVEPLPTPAASAPTTVQPDWQPISPRVGLSTTEPAIKQLPAVTRPQPSVKVEAAPPVLPKPIPPVNEPARIRQDQPPKMTPPTPLPREFFTPPKTTEMVPPEPPGSSRPVLPQPQPVPEEPELPVAPPDLMKPAGATVPGQHGTFGSRPINISRDFPTFFADDIRTRMGVVGASNDFYGDRNRGFVQAEYLMWWATPLQMPLLGTTNTLGGFGFVGEPGTQQILGPGQIIGPFRNGVRARAGTWLGECNNCGIDGSFFYLANKSVDIVRTSDQFPIITRPIFSPNPRPGGGGIIGNSGEAVTVPGILTGSLTAHADSVIYGFDANIRKCLHTCCDSHAEWFVGYRNVSMQETLSITENINVVGPGGGRVDITDPVGSVVFVRDTFKTNNYFHGGQIGALYERQWGRFSAWGRGSIAFGVTHQEVNIDGFQVRNIPGRPPMTFTGGGLLAAGPNIGNFTRNEFSVVPELTLNVGYRVSPSLRVYGGWNLLYWSNVVRPGDQIDGVVDVTFVPNAPALPPSGLQRPTVPFRQSDMWISGIQFGAEWRW